MLTDNTDAVYNTVKFLGILVTGILGVIGLITEFRNKETKRITIWGRIALVLIVSTTCVALVTQFIDSSKQASNAKDAADKAQSAAADARAQVARSNRILHEVQRSLSSLKDVRISYSYRVPLDDPSLASYRERLLKGVRDLAADYLKNQDFDPVAYVMIPDKTGGAQKVVITPKSSLFPQPSETVAFYLMRFSGVNLSFYTTPASISAHSEKDADRRPHPSLEWEAYISKDTDATFGRWNLEYDFRTATLEIVVTGVPAFARVSDGRIISIIDLAGAQLVAGEGGRTIPWGGPTTGLSPVVEDISKARAKLELTHLSLQVNERIFGLISEGGKRNHSISSPVFSGHS